MDLIPNLGHHLLSQTSVAAMQKAKGGTEGQWLLDTRLKPAGASMQQDKEAISFSKPLKAFSCTQKNIVLFHPMAKSSFAQGLHQRRAVNAFGRAMARIHLTDGT